MLVHTALDRAERIARVWADAGCPVAIHLDAKNPTQDFTDLSASLSDQENISFTKRHRCDWGSWGLVQATLDAAAELLQKHPNLSHVYLSSGSCLPLRPVNELIDYLDNFPQTDFIESANIDDVSWIVGGLGHERFTMRFPFSWKKHRKLFDLSVRTQRALGVSRRIPSGLVPHMGSQWWCLTTKTLSAILNDPNRLKYDAYFSKVWIPDESYFQTLARKHSRQIESKSLTLSKFDYQGKPHVFYDDHLQLLRRSDCFVARKIWPKADRLYEYFLGPENTTGPRMAPAPGKIDRLFTRSLERRVLGRPGLYMQSRFPNVGRENGKTAKRYYVFEGFNDLFDHFPSWLSRMANITVHGHLFHPIRAEFSNGQDGFIGGLTSSPEIRDRNPQAFLTNLLWNGRSERHAFQFGPDDNQKIGPFMASDPNAHFNIITGAWAVPLYKSDMAFRNKRQIAANLQKIETQHIKMLREPWVKARVRIWSMADFVEAVAEPIQQIMGDFGRADQGKPLEMPIMRDLDGFPEFLQELKNAGMHPHIMGDFPATLRGVKVPDPKRKPYVTR